MNRSLFIKVFTVDGIKEIEGLQSSVIPCRCHQPYRMLVGHGIAQALTSIPCQFENIPLGFHSSEIRPSGILARRPWSGVPKKILLY